MAWYVHQSFAHVHQPRLMHEPPYRPPYSEWMQDGKPVLPEDVPRTITVMSSPKRLSCFISGTPPFSVCGPFCDLIEGLEPGRHQFVPLNIRYKDGRPAERPYYAFNILTVLNAIIPEQSQVEWNVRPSSRTEGNLTISGGRKLTIRHDVVVGCHVWRDLRWFLGVFFSDELMAAVKKTKLTGIESYVVDEA